MTTSAAAAPKQPVICEYFIQNEHQGQSDPYRNVFILPNKYTSIKDVQLGDVIKAFPLKDSQYVLRFQYMVQLASKKTRTVWLDIGKNMNVPCPNMQGKIVIKALRLPKGVQTKFKAVFSSKKAAPAPVQEERKQPPAPMTEKKPKRDSVISGNNPLEQKSKPLQQTPKPMRTTDFFDTSSTPLAAQ